MENQQPYYVMCDMIDLLYPLLFLVASYNLSKMELDKERKYEKTKEISVESTENPGNKK